MIDGKVALIVYFFRCLEGMRSTWSGPVSWNGGLWQVGITPIGFIYIDVRRCVVETRVQGSLSLTDVFFVALTAGDEIKQPSLFLQWKWLVMGFVSPVIVLVNLFPTSIKLQTTHFWRGICWSQWNLNRLHQDWVRSRWRGGRGGYGYGEMSKEVVLGRLLLIGPRRVGWGDVYGWEKSFCRV